MGCELRECSTGESGGEATRSWVAPASTTSFHLTGYPGDLKFPGRSDQYFSIFCLVGNWTKFWIFIWTDFDHRQQDVLGTRLEVPPPCNFLMTRGGGGEVKTRQAEPGGGWRCEGGRDFFFQEARMGV